MLAVCSDVAPRAGAWIETIALKIVALSVKSHPVRVRGLKRSIYNQVDKVYVSHPVRVRGLKHIFMMQGIPISVSHPVRVRGLKHFILVVGVLDILSHPVRVRGLKPVCCHFPCEKIGRTPCGCVD